jgi:arsenite-transporting ATPase
VPRLTFFIGKGGVGKTTLASSYAVRRARKHPRECVLLVSTDPAHSLADIFQLRLGKVPKRIDAKAQLFAWQIDAEGEFRKFLDDKRESLLELVESGTLFTRAEIEPLLDTTLPGMSELGALLILKDLVRSDEWGEIVVDTAPVGHTLRLFSLPGHFNDFLRFLDLAGNRDRWLTQRFGAKRQSPTEALLQELTTASEEMQAVISGENARVYLVTSPEMFSLKQAVRSVAALTELTSELPLEAVIINRAVRDGKSCEHCSARAQRTHGAQRFLQREFVDLPQRLSEDPGFPIIGADALARHGETVFGKTRYRLAAQQKAAASARLKQEDWPQFPQRLSFTVGKGGVGKTTVSASLAYLARESQKTPVTVCSTDPAPSLDEIFQTDVSDSPVSVLGDRGLHAIEIDSVAEFRAWAERMQEKIGGAMSQQQGRIHVDVSFDRQVFMALLDIVPPGVDEIFAIFKILDLTADARQRVVIDMAPTGHALELLRMPERMAVWARLLLKTLAAHRTLALAQDAAVEIATVGQRVRKLLATMQDRRQSCAVAVMLPEPLPDRQTQRLLEQLEALGIHVSAVMVNRVLLDNDRCGRCANAQRWQRKVLDRLRRSRPAVPVYLLAEQRHEVAGKKALAAFTRRVWRMV